MNIDDPDWGPMGPPAGATPTGGLLPPSVCPQPCPVTVDILLCRPRSHPQVPVDPFGDPKWSPPGVRVVPEWETRDVKPLPGGPVLIGPGGQFVYPTPMLPEGSRGLPTAAGVLSDLDDDTAPTPVAAGIVLPAFLRQIPWWGWAALAVLLLRRRRRSR